MQLNLHRQPLTEHVSPAAKEAAGALVVARQNARGQRTGAGTGEGMNALGVADDLLPGHAWFAAAFVLRGFVPGGPVADTRGGDEGGNIAKAGGVAGEKGDGLAVDIDFRTDDDLDGRIAVLRGELSADYRAEVGVVGYRNAAVTEGVRAGDDSFGGGGAVTE